MRAIVFVLCCLLAFSSTAYSATTGKVAFWDASASSQSTNRIKHTTRSVSIESALEVPAKFDGKYEAIVHLRSGAMLKHDNVLNGIKTSANAEVLSNVHSADSSIESAIAKGSHMNEAQSVSLGALFHFVKDGAVLKDGKTDAYTVSVDTSDASTQSTIASLLAATSALPAGQVLYIASEETPTTTVLPAGHDTRQLSASAQSESKQTLKHTKTAAPATGAEFSIYYEGTYLYITPDIFTGLLTMLFMFFVVLIGLNCMGDIQGMSSFYDKVPSNGKEA